MDLERELKSLVRQIRPGLIGATSNPNINLTRLIDELKSSPKRAQEISAALMVFLVSRDFTTALTESGLTMESGVFSEIYKRLEYKVLPRELESLDIVGFIGRVFDGADADWLEDIDHKLFADLLSLILPDPQKLVEPLVAQVFMSLEVLGLRLAGFGYDPAVTSRLKQRREFQHAFMEVPRHVHGLLDGKGESAIAETLNALERCSQAVRWIRSRRNVQGISLGLTYRLMKIQQVVRRMELVLKLIQGFLGDTPKGSSALDLFFEIVLAEIRRFEIRRFIGQNVELLAFQITEHTGKAGEHYITRTRLEWTSMFRSALLGGAVVAGLAVIKILLAKLHLPPGPEIIAYGSLYAGGFVLIHTIGGTLATKQPAMTAATLAASLDEAKNSSEAMEQLSETIIRTIRSQMGALFGNYIVAFPVAALILLPFMMINIPLMSTEKAWATIESLDILRSLSIWYAAVAGLCLFVSGLLAGFADNWFVFNNVGARLRQSELLSRVVGARNLERSIQMIDHNLGFWVGNISLGFFLASMGAFGTIMGLPLDVRHITFSSATLGAAMASLNFQISVGLAFWLAFSVFVMGLVNLAISFSLSLLLAVKSRRIRFSQTPELMNLLAKRFIKSPLEFLFPVRDTV